MAETSGRLFREIGVSGLDFTAGYVRADPDYKLQGQLGVEQYDLMRHTDPTVAAVLMALSLPVREAKWRVNPASSSPVDVEAAEFVESCLHDMSFSWDDVLTEISTMFAFGWAYMEWILKARQGANPKKGGTPSQYDDGRIGFKKIALRGQASLHRWDIEEETGKLKGMYQWGGINIMHIPLDKAILFRTTKELNNPEGFSVLRPAHRAWQYKRNLERFEAIGIQRAMQGMPVIKLLQGATRAGTVNTGESTEERAEKIIKRLYDNLMFGVIEDIDMEFRFEAPDMRGVSQDSGAVIQRYDEAIARAALAMYILLGTRERGSYALAKELGDLFFLAVEGFINMIAQTFSKWGVPILFHYNNFPGITGYPEVTTAINRRVDIQTLADFVNKLVQAQVLVPDEELERHIRELADLPAPAIQVGGELVTPAEGEPSEDTAGPPSDEGQEGESSRMAASRRRDAENFARKSLSGYNSATNAYQAELRRYYTEWVDRAVGEMNDKDLVGNNEALSKKWKALIIIGLLGMKKKGYQYLPQAFALGYGSESVASRSYAALVAEIEENDQYLEQKLWRRIERALSLQDLQEITRLFAAGLEKEARSLMAGVLMGIAGNVGQYSGAYWRAIWIGSIAAEEDREQERLQQGEISEEDEDWDEWESAYVLPVRWNLDALARHCSTCLLFGDRDYIGLADLLATTNGVLPGQGTECDGNCRCWITVLRDGAWVLL